MSLKCLIIKSKSIYGFGVAIRAFSKILCLLWLRGVGHNPGGPPSMSLNDSYHKKQGYVWIRGGDLNGFWDMRPFMKWWGGAYPQGTPGLYHRMRLIIRNNMYGLGVGIWMVSEIYGLLNWKRVWQITKELCPCQWMHLIIRNNKIYCLWVGIWMVSEILVPLWSEVKGVGHAVAAILDFNRLSFSYFVFLRCSDAPQQVSTQMDYSL